MKLDAMYIVVSDMSVAREFYARLFDREPSLVEERFSGFDLGGTLFGLFNAAYFGEPVDARGVVYGNNCVPNIRIDEVDRLYSRLQVLEGAELTPVQKVGMYRLFQVQDVDGNRVEFYEVRG